MTLSYAQTVDGRIATAGGSSQWISGPASLTHAHRLRADHDAIMVGAGTVCADDPRLTVRLVDGTTRCAWSSTAGFASRRRLRSSPTVQPGGRSWR